MKITIKDHRLNPINCSFNILSFSINHINQKACLTITALMKDFLEIDETNQKRIKNSSSLFNDVGVYLTISFSNYLIDCLDILISE